MLNFGPTFIWVAINLFVLYMILKYVFFKPVTEFMENRSNTIKQSMEDAEESKAKAASMKRQYEEQFKNAKTEIEKMVGDARHRAEMEYDQVISTARKEAQALMVKAREDFEVEKESIKKGLKDHISDLVISIASKIMQTNMDNDKNRILVNKFINSEEDGVS